MPLTPEERQRIYEEERARIEARAQAESDVKIEREAAQVSALSKPTNSLGTVVLTVVLLTLLGGGGVWFYNETFSKQPVSSVSAINTSTQFLPVENSIPSAAETSIKVAADTLYQAYDDNQIDADGKYKGRTLSISGTVQDIKNDILDEPPCVPQ